MAHEAPLGAHVIDGGRVSFGVWAPDAERVEVEISPSPQGIVRHEMVRDRDGVWTAIVSASPGLLYRYRLNGEWGYPDPCSRSQPDGVHGPSQVVDPRAFGWSDAAWSGLDPKTLIIYELHVGTYTSDGTFDALIGELDELADLGVTALELMPVAEFPGLRNWGYDGAALFAPSSVYGGPDGLRRLVDAAHATGLGIILDVVYNHLGPEGNYLRNFADHYFTDRYKSQWDHAVNFDGENSRHVRDFFIENALMWVDEYHIDGFRLDATHNIFDASSKHILQELAEAVQERNAGERTAFVMAEDERNDLRLVLPRDQGGYGLDGLWVDDFHHSVHVMLTEEDRGFLGGYEGTAEEIARLLRVGYLYASPPDGPGEQPVGVAEQVPAEQLVYCLENHDQVGNRPEGRRLLHLVDLELFKAAVALLLHTPCTPLLFMGSEFASSAPFYFFTDYGDDLGDNVMEGRQRDFAGFWGPRDAQRFGMPDPQAEETFLQSKLDLTERAKPRHEAVYRLYRELLRIRREDPVLRDQHRWRLLAEAPAPALVAVERWSEDEERRLLLVNFGHATPFDLGEQAWMGGAAKLSWWPMISTAEEQFAGPGADMDALVLEGGRAVEMPSRSAVLWRADGA